MTGDDWIRPDRELPTDGEVVDTLDGSGRRAELRYKRGLWWFPDMTMYVYYVPTFWKRKEATNDEK